MTKLNLDSNDTYFIIKNMLEITVPKLSNTLTKVESFYKDKKLVVMLEIDKNKLLNIFMNNFVLHNIDWTLIINKLSLKDTIEIINQNSSLQIKISSSDIANSHIYKAQMNIIYELYNIIMSIYNKIEHYIKLKFKQEQEKFFRDTLIKYMPELNDSVTVNVQDNINIILKMENYIKKQFVQRVSAQILLTAIYENLTINNSICQNNIVNFTFDISSTSNEIIDTLKQFLENIKNSIKRILIPLEKQKLINKIMQNILTLNNSSEYTIGVSIDNLSINVHIHILDILSSIFQEDYELKGEVLDIVYNNIYKFNACLYRNTIEVMFPLNKNINNISETVIDIINSIIEDIKIVFNKI